MRILAALLTLATLLFADSAAGIHWTAPPGWKSEGSRPMRAATYSIPGAAAGTAECVVYFFGAGQGGSVEANLDRWKGQFKQPGGKPADAHIQKRTVHGLPVTTIDIAGEYSGMGGPTATQTTVASGYRLLGAIIEGPGGNLFIKFAGPAKIAADNQKNFEQLVSSFEKEAK